MKHNIDLKDIWRFWSYLSSKLYLWSLRGCIKLHALLSEFFPSLLDLPDELMICLIAVPQGEQVPPDVDQGLSTEEHYPVEGQGQHEEQPRVVWVMLEFFACAVTEEERCQGTEPSYQNEDWFLHNLIESSHFIYYSFSL